MPRSDGSKGGRPGFDRLLMFKVLLLQAVHGLSDERCEDLIKDRLSFMRCLGLADPVPDAKTTWSFRAARKPAGAVDALFARFDAMIVAAPRQRNTEAERASIKAGKIPQGWTDKPATLRRKDRDARWTVTFCKAGPREDGAPQVDLAVPASGYRNHVSIDRRHGLIRGWTRTHAAVHGGARLEEGLDADNTASGVWADTAYRSAKNAAMLRARGLVSRIHRKTPKGRAMPLRTRRANAAKSALCSGADHIPARQMGRMGLAVRTIGLARARVRIGLANLAYTMRRFVWLSSRAASA